MLSEVSVKNYDCENIFNSSVIIQHSNFYSPILYIHTEHTIIGLHSAFVVTNTCIWLHFASKASGRPWQFFTDFRSSSYDRGAF